MIIDLKIVPEVTDNRFSMIDDGGVEIETGELVYGLVRRLKPENVLSTGIYTGVSDLFIGQALKDNGFGHLTALEFEPRHVERARKLWEEKGVSSQITPVLGESLKFEPDKQYQFMFLDTEPHLRFNELVKFFPNLDGGSYVLIHDLHEHWSQGSFNPDHPELPSYPFGNLPQEIKDWVKQDKLRPISFPGARGLSGFYKPKSTDFQWYV